jgi:Glycosyl hydrolase family 12
MAAGGVVAVSLPAASSEAAVTPKTLCQSQTAAVDSRGYTAENNEWGSGEPECITTDGGAGFTVAKSSIANSTYGAPGGYPALYKGCHWGVCTPGSGFPIQVSDIRPGRVTTSWSTAQPGGSNDYDVAYDIWFNKTPTTTGQPDGTELMIWLNHNGPVQPFGTKVASNVSIGGRGYNVWFGNQGWNTLSYTMTSGTTSVSNLDLQPLIADAISRGYISPSWYLIDVEAGFELWHGGAGLATHSFSVKVTGRGVPAPTPIQTSPVSQSALASPTPSSTATGQASPSASATSSSPAPTSSASPSSSPASPSAAASPTSPAPVSSGSPSSSPTSPAPTGPVNISLQAISPSPSSSGTSTNVTVDFKNLGSTMASNLTLVTKILNSAGKVEGSQSQTGQNVAPQSTLNVSYPWSAVSTAGTYTIEALVQDSAGKTLEHAKVGTVTVK